MIIMAETLEQFDVIAIKLSGVRVCVSDSKVKGVMATLILYNLYTPYGKPGYMYLCIAGLNKAL